jgi:uncharacterized repeat protein (TIGR03843 family)
MPTDELTQPAGPDTDPLTILASGEIEIVGRMPWSSNATFLVTLHDGDQLARAIYKPGKGERPLWDFPNGLFRREAAAYELSHALGFDVVPPTIVRGDGPMGDGSLQWFIEADFKEHYFSLHEHRPEFDDQFRAMALFDVIANNTDRKSGHCLLDANGRVWGIDNGLCFAEEYKLRTVIWEFADEPIAEQLLAPVRRLLESVPLPMAALLTDDEIMAMLERAEAILDDPIFPNDETGRRYPWPLV